MSRHAQAIATIKRIIIEQERAQLRLDTELWGAEKAKARFRPVTGTSNFAQNPELAIIAPHRGDFEIAGFKIQRRQIDQLDNFSFWRV